MAAEERSAHINELLVDAGSEYTWLPKDTLIGIGVRVRKPNQQFVMANGAVITRDIGYAILKTDGFETVDEVVFAESGDLNLLVRTHSKDLARLSMLPENNWWPRGRI